MFSSGVKNAEVTPIFQKGLKIKVENYRPVSILPNASKLLKMPLFDHIFSYFGQILSDNKSEFRKGFNPQRCLRAVIEK